VALTSRDQLLGNDGTSAWCPWWWSSSWHGLSNQVEEVTPTAVLHPLPTSCHSTSDHDPARQEVNQKRLNEAEEFIAAQAEYVALPQKDSTDDSSPDDCQSNIPSHPPTLIHYHASLQWLHSTLPWRGVKAVTSRCAHVNPLRNLCDSAVFPQKPAATRIAVMNTVCTARATLWTTRISQANVASCQRSGRPVLDTILQEIRGNLVELAVWRQIAQDPSGFAMAVKACGRAADDLAAALREQLQLDRHPASIRTICDFDTWKNAGTPTDPTLWSFHALYESSIFLCLNDSRLREALQNPAIGGITTTDSSWVSSSIHADLSASVEVVEFSIPQWQTVTSHDPNAARPARVYIAGNLNNHWKLLAVRGPAKSWGHVSNDDAGQVTSRRPSQFLPEKFRWTDTVIRKPNGDPDFSSGLKLKSLDCTGVMSHRKNWNMIKKRGGACQAILDGKFCFPTVKESFAHCSHPNLKSIEEDKALLYRMICKYLISGVSPRF